MIKDENGEELRGRGLVEAAHPWLEWSARHTIGASTELAELVRYLNHATQTQEVREALPFPSQMDSVVGDLASAVSRMPQLFEQLAGRLKEWRADPYFSTDDDPRKGVTAVMRGYAAEQLLAVCMVQAEMLAQTLGGVRAQTNHLKFDPRD